MNEPIYEYIRGQGWVIKNAIIAPDRKGRLWRLELRKPNPGERCCYCSEDWDLEQWRDWLVRSTVFTYDDLKNSLSGCFYWCTFIPVEQ